MHRFNLQNPTGRPRDPEGAAIVPAQGGIEGGGVNAVVDQRRLAAQSRLRVARPFSQYVGLGLSRLPVPRNLVDVRMGASTERLILHIILGGRHIGGICKGMILLLNLLFWFLSPA